MEFQPAGTVQSITPPVRGPPGARARPPNYNLLANLVRLKFQGRLYPVNPNVPEIDGMKAYPGLKSIEDELDMVVSSVPAAATLDVIKDCVDKRVKVVVIVSGGFSEVGQDGRKVQDEIALLLKKAGIRAIGPNCLSPVNTSNNLVIGFDPHEKLHKGQAHRSSCSRDSTSRDWSGSFGT